MFTYQGIHQNFEKQFGSLSLVKWALVPSGSQHGMRSEQRDIDFQVQQTRFIYQILNTLIVSTSKDPLQKEAICSLK